MANYTTNYNLEKPLQDEFYDVDISNANMDKIDTALNENAEAANDHIANKNNPHGVTASQIGLGNVNNTSDANKPVSTAQATAIADAKKAATDHIADKNNPHGVTASQVGAAPKAHASSATTYGIGTSSNYGHVKLSDSVSNTSAASAGVAASPKAVKSAYDLANAALPKAGGTVTGEIHIDMNAPAIQLNDLDSTAKTRILKNAGSSSDYGTYISDFAADGTRDTLILNRSSDQEQKLQLRIQQDDGTDETYEIYGEHHPEVNTLYAKSSVSLARTVDTSFLGLLGGNNASAGALLELCGKNHSSLKGYFRLHAKDGTNSVYMEGRPDGKLYWNGVLIPTDVEDYIIESYRNGTEWYEVYKSGKVRQGGLTSISGSNVKKTQTFLKAFADTNYTLVGISFTSADTTLSERYLQAKTKTSFDVHTYGTSLAGGFHWVAEGQGA